MKQKQTELTKEYLRNPLWHLVI